MKKATCIYMLILLACSAILLTSCASSERLDLTSDQTHKLCKTYEKDVEWIKLGAIQPSIRELEKGIESLNKSQGMCFCSFEITDVEFIKKLDNDYYQFKLTATISHSHIGDLKKGQKFTKYITQSNADAGSLIGKQYITFLQFEAPLAKNQHVTIWNYWTFLICEDSTLVSPFGCSIEEDAQDLGIALDSRNYTGQKLDYFIDVVKRLDTENK